MSKLDNLKPTGGHGLYKVEVQVEGEWVMMCLMSKESIITLTDQAENLSDEDVESSYE